MKIFFFFLLSLIPILFISVVLIILPKQINAQSLNFTTIPLDQNGTPTFSHIDENTPKVRITFTNLLEQNYDLCLGWGSRPEDRYPGCGTDGFNHHFKASDIHNGTLSIDVCGGSVDAGLFGAKDKIFYPNLPGLKTDCDSGDYFHAHNYAFELRPQNGAKTKWDNGLQVGFFIPDINLTPSKPTDQDNIQINFPFNSSRSPADYDKRNEYSFKLKKSDGQFNPNISNLIVPSSGSAKVTLPQLPNGLYTLTISKEHNDPHFDDKWLEIEGLAKVFSIKIDPNGGSITSQTSGSGTIVPPSGNLGDAKSVQTGIGDILTDPSELTNSLIRIALGIAGGIAFLLIIYGGFRLVFSQGDPKATQEGREVITSAVIGLIIIIFAVFLLRLIGIDILGLPL